MSEFDELSKALFGKTDRLSVWESIAQLPRPFTPKQVAHATEVPYSNVYKEFKILEQFGFIVRASAEEVDEYPDDEYADDEGSPELKPARHIYALADPEFWGHVAGFIGEFRQRLDAE